jgi:hypothetical protein
MTTINELKTALCDPRFIAVWQEMQTDPVVLAQYEFDEAIEHFRRAQTFLELARQSAVDK